MATLLLFLWNLFCIVWSLHSSSAFFGMDLYLAEESGPDFIVSLEEFTSKKLTTKILQQIEVPSVKRLLMSVLVFLWPLSQSSFKILLRTQGSGARRPRGGKATSGSHQTLRNRRPSHTNNFMTRRVANRLGTPITRPRDLGSSV